VVTIRPADDRNLRSFGGLSCRVHSRIAIMGS
jgi:hypothetical protein